MAIYEIKYKFKSDRELSETELFALMTLLDLQIDEPQVPTADGFPEDAEYKTEIISCDILVNGNPLVTTGGK